VRRCGKSRVVEEILAAHRLQQVLEMRLRDDVDRHMAVGGRKDVIGCSVQPRLAVAGARRDLACTVVVVVARRECRPDRILHRYLDEPAGAAAVAVVKRGHDAGI